jgi:hypothetical protein
MTRMTRQRQPNPRHSTPPPDTQGDWYDHAVPRQGYTAPVPPSLYGGSPPQPERRPANLRARAGVDSMAWWRLKTRQGALMGGALALAGVMVAIVLVVIGVGGTIPPGVGLGLIGLGALVCLRYLAAPLTCRWIVTVPENRYWVVEDYDGYTIEYLEPGRLIVPWRRNTRCRPYVAFNTVAVTELVEDVLDSDALPVDIEVSIVMTYNPARADPGYFAMLRQMRSPEQFGAMLARDVRDIVRKHLSLLDPVAGQHMLHDIASLEGVIVGQLEARGALGLFLASDRPVTVHVRAPQQVKQAVQAQWARAREGSQTLLAIKELARELNLPYEQAFQLFYVMQRGGAPGLEHTTPPIVVVHPTSGQPAWTGPAHETAEHRPVTPPPPESSPVPRLIADPEQAPDPFDVRRRRRARRDE